MLYLIFHQPLVLPPIKEVAKRDNEQLNKLPSESQKTSQKASAAAFLPVRVKPKLLKIF